MKATTSDCHMINNDTKHSKQKEGTAVKTLRPSSTRASWQADLSLLNTNPDSIHWSHRDSVHVQWNLYTEHNNSLTEQV